MKIVILTKNLSESNGWGRYSLEIVKRLKKNIEVEVLVEGEEAQNLKVLKSFISFLKNLILVRKKARKADIVHAFDGWPFGVYGYFAVLGTGKKLFISGHGTYTVAPLDSFLKGFILEKAYLRANKIFCNSRYTASEILKRVSRAKVEVVPLGTSQFTEVNLYDDKTRSIISEKNPTVITVGALKKRKGQIYTMQAISILKKDFPNILYVMVGDDSDVSYKNELIDLIREKKLEENVLFLKDIKDQELPEWYKSADVQALNSVNHDGHFEGFGLVILEGYQFGLPAVGSRDCGIEDAISDGETGYLAEQKNPEDIAEKIRIVLEKGKLSFSEDCQKYSRKFNWDKTVLEYLKYYKH
ncbi:glycosyltransferase family 4 protein [Candidatus Parcubacteria bacterium]|nr:glycosyltransferase family 4 protein [Candidatus Parcubacteria bacterium]